MCTVTVYNRKRPVSGAVIARQGETPRAVLAVLASFMVETRVASRCGEAPSEGGKKAKEKKRNAYKKKGDGATRITPGVAARNNKKEKEKKKKKRTKKKKSKS